MTAKKTSGSKAPPPKPVLPVPREGSRKRKVYDVFKAKGREAALKHGVTLDLKPSTLGVWVNAWARSTVKAATPKAT